MSLRAASPPPRATTPEPTFQPLPSPRLRPSRSIRQLKTLAPITTTLSSHDTFHLTFDEFGTDHHSSKTPSQPHRTRRKSGPVSPLQSVHHHKSPRRSGSPPPPAHHNPTPPPPLPPLPSFLVSTARKSPNSYSFDTPDISIFPSSPSTSSDESVNSRCYPIHRSN